jgi:hypothetical protein
MTPIAELLADRGSEGTELRQNYTCGVRHVLIRESPRGRAKGMLASILWSGRRGQRSRQLHSLLVRFAGRHHYLSYALVRRFRVGERRPGMASDRARCSPPGAGDRQSALRSRPQATTTYDADERSARSELNAD